MGRTATLIAVTYALLGGAVVLAIGAVVWGSTKSRLSTDTKKLAEREQRWFAIVVVLLAALLFATIFFTPYGRSSGSAEQTFAVGSQQFAFVIPGTTLKAGRSVKFRLTSKDVNHGFAVFNDKNVFLFQVQVMPGKTQEYVYTFKKPGRYHVVCFEYCGVGHDRMAGDFTVTR